ncbi:uncharacterized protein ARMOST_11396 [Armillaria ostoyae]|uniref:Uncharacterized protein n=1 Tax=Armillaria ostoyae TaxID=47428 RepID=A0A284RH34_ARMOS|nr:uncharacterized protein ARMOST_11396 [Armillaria ostoyae]
MPSSHRRFVPDHFSLQRLSRDLILEIFAWCLSCSRSVDNAFPNLMYRIYLCKDLGCIRIHTQIFLIGDIAIERDTCFHSIPRREQHANEMREWAAEYGHELIVMNKKNHAFLKIVTRSKCLDYQDTLCTPTIH